MRAKFIFQLLFSLAFIFLLVNLYSNEAINKESLALLWGRKLILLILLLYISNYTVSFLFYLLLVRCSNKNISFFSVSSTFLQGTVVNLLLPGSGLAYKYFKFKIEENVNLIEYSSAKILFYAQRILAFILLALYFGYLIVSFNKNFIINILYVVIILITLTVIFRKRIYNFVKSMILKSKQMNIFFEDLVKIKNIFKKNFFYFCSFIFLFLIQLIFECLIFSFFFNYLNLGISFEVSSFLYVSTFLASSLILINFIGLFEFVLAFSSTFFNESFTEIIFIGFAFRLFNIISILIVILSNYLIKFYYK